MDDLFARLQEEMDRDAPQPGIDPSALIELPDNLRRLVQRIARMGDST